MLYKLSAPALLLSTVGLYWIPDGVSAFTILFMAIFGIGMAASFGTSFMKSEVGRDSIGLVVWFSFLMVNFLINEINENDSLGWIRSVFPLLLIFSYPLFKAWGNESPEKVPRFIVWVCVFWCLYQVAVYGTNPVATILGGKRATWENGNLIVPYPMIGLLVATVLVKDKGLIVWISILFLAVMLLAAGYKMQILICVAAISYWIILKEGRKYWKHLIIPVAALILVAPIFIGESTELEFYIQKRIEATGGEGDLTRIEEIRQAWSIFKKSPVFGDGYGIRFYSKYSDSGEKNYIHNSILYHLAAGGILGVLIMLGIMYRIIKPVFFSKQGREVVLILALLLLSTFTAASYKLIHFNIMFVALLAYARCIADKESSC